MIIASFKRVFYFPVASYFRFFAAIRLKRWNPKVLVVTGSNGKTTLLHMLEAQIGKRARYSHHANSSFGIPFDILDLHRKTLLKSEWASLLLKAPINAFKNPPKERLYIVEADCDRAGEGKFLASLLRPSIVLWASTAKTHSMNFEHLVNSHPRGVPQAQHHPGGGLFNTVEEAIAYEFGYFLEYCKDLAIVNGDSELMLKQMGRTKARIVQIKKEKSLNRYEVSKKGTGFKIEDDVIISSSSERSESRSLSANSSRQARTINTYKFKYLLPEEVFYSIEMCRKLCEYLNISFDQSFPRFNMPPGRGSIFKGINNTNLVDSSYNATPSSLKAIIDMYNKMAINNKWIVISDMVEMGEEEGREHEKIADLLAGYKFDLIILMGPRLMKHALPKLRVLIEDNGGLVAFETPKEVLEFLKSNIKGGETILFKGARFMEGIIEHLLMDKNDVKKLSRREKIWDIRRKQWGF